MIRAYDVFHENERKGREIARPSTFVLDGAGVIVWRYVGEESKDRPALDDVLARIP